MWSTLHPWKGRHSWKKASVPKPLFSPTFIGWINVRNDTSVNHRSTRGSAIPYPYSLAFQWSNVCSGKIQWILKVIKVIKAPFPWVIFPISEGHLSYSASAGMDSARVFRLGFEVGYDFIGSWYLNFSPFLSGSKKCIRASTWSCLCFSPQEKTKLFLPSKYSSLNCTHTILRAQDEITDRSSSSSFL